MIKFKIIGDPENRPFCSSQIIIDSTNNAAKKLELYDDNGIEVSYDCLGKDWGNNTQFRWVAYELNFPYYILQNVANKVVLGLSKGNTAMAINAGHLRELTDYVSLGCDTDKVWKPKERTKFKDKFIVSCICESTVRSGIDLIIQAFAECFSGYKDVILYLKDREPNKRFCDYVSEMKSKHNIEIIHHQEHTTNHEIERDIYANSDLHICLNHCHTFGLVMLQGLAVGCPLVAMKYQGPDEYLIHEFNGIAIDYDLVDVTQEELNRLSNIGMKNFLFPIIPQNYPVQPTWAHPRIESIKEAMLKLKDDSKLREKLKNNGITTAKWMSWERTAINMSLVLDRFIKKIKL